MKTFLNINLINQIFIIYNLLFRYKEKRFFYMYIMRVNVIHNDKSSNVMMDAELLSYILKRVKQKPKVEHIHVNSYKIEEASLNICLETFNYYHLNKAKYNIFIPNFQYFHKNWTELASTFDLIICKTQYCYDIFKDLVPEEKLVFIGWRSPDFSIPNMEKEYDQYLLVYNDHYFNDLQKIINIWNEDYPTLNIVFNGIINNHVKRRNLPNINYIEKLSSEKFELLLNKCIVHFCLDNIDNYNHNIVQCQLAKSVPVIVNKGPALEIAETDNCFMVSSLKKKNKGGIGSIYRYSEDDLKYTLDKVIATKPNILDIMGKECNIFSTKNQHIFLDKMTHLLNDIFEKTINIKFNRKDIDLPKMSIVTPVHNLPDIFKIAVLNYTSTSYPRHLLEWIIVDDSDKGKDVDSLLPKQEHRDKFNIRYIRLTDQTDLYEKYNLGVEAASHDIILNMGPDDFFYEKGFELIVSKLLRSDKQCVGMVQYGCFDINRYISMIHVNYITLPYYLRMHEGSLCYHKSFWETQKYGNGDLQSFLEGRYHDLCEINYEQILIGLIHTRNSDKRVIDEKQEANGCHFNFTEKLFKYVCSLDKQKIEDNEKRQREIEEIRAAAEEEEPNEIKEETEKNESPIENSSEVKEI
jgi:hypothetical protein